MHPVSKTSATDVVALHDYFTHCILRRYVWALKTLSPGLQEELSDGVKNMNYIFTTEPRDLNYLFFRKKWGNDVTALLFHTELRWKLRGKVVHHVQQIEE